MLLIIFLAAVVAMDDEFAFTQEYTEPRYRPGPTRLEQLLPFNEPLNPIPANYPTITDIGSHNACRRIATLIAKRNPHWCGPENPLGTWYSEDVGSVYSLDAKECSNQAQCHAHFECRARKPYKGCSSDVLQKMFNRRWKMFCVPGNVVDIQRPGERKAWVECISPGLSQIRKQRDARIAAERGELVWKKKENGDEFSTELVISSMLADLTILGDVTCEDILAAGGSLD